MLRFFKYLLLALLTLILPLALYVGYLWATYISNEVFEGAKYGFTIDSTREQAYANVLESKDKYPELFVYVNTGPRAGDLITFSPNFNDLQKIEPYDQWDLLIDGESKFFNSIRVTFHDDRVFKIYRHRQYFELP